MVFASLGIKFGYEKAFKISRWIGCVFAIIILSLFVFIAINGKINLSLLFFCSFVFFGAISREKENKYIKIFGVLDEQNLKRGTIVKTFAVHKDMKIKRLISILDERAVNQVLVFDKREKIASLNQSAIENMIEGANIYSSIAENLP